MKTLIYYLLIIALLILSCAPSTKPFEELPPQVLLAKSDSLINVYPDKPELVNAIINARLHLAEKNNDFSQYHEVLKIEPNNPMAQYYILMNTGKQYHEKEYKNGQWEAIQSFSKASAIIDSLGEPHFWIGKAYEKKDEMDFELTLEAYDKSLNLYLPGFTFLNLKAPRLLVSVRCDSVPSSINRSTVVPPTFSPETSNTVPEIFRGFCPTRTVASAKSTNITLMNDLFNITFFAILSLPRIVWHLMSIVIRWRKFNHALRLNQVKNI